VSLSTGLAIYFIIWWVVLFTVLPWGIRSQHETGSVADGTDPGAPAVPALRKKLVWTTLVATIVFGICYVVYTEGWITAERFTTLFGWLDWDTAWKPGQ
jgi:predicted secreted protein